MVHLYPFLLARAAFSAGDAGESTNGSATSSDEEEVVDAEVVDEK